jgi:hypothetical protein
MAGVPVKMNRSKTVFSLVLIQGFLRIFFFLF